MNGKSAGQLQDQPSLTPSSIDTEFPIECDDEFWDTPDPAMMFKQPEGTPSKMTAFILTIQLNQILLTCLRALVSALLRHSVGFVRSLMPLLCLVLDQKNESQWRADESTVGG